MEGELTEYRYDQEAEMVDAHRDDFEAGRVHFVFDSEADRWRKVVTQ